MEGKCPYCLETDELSAYRNELVCELCIEEFENNREMDKIDFEDSLKELE